MFITFEGPDGCGKSTQHELLTIYLKKELNKDIVATREPGGTAIGIAIRKILLNSPKDSICDLTELLLFAADRAQHVKELIVPALKNGKIVLCDRFIDSTYAYQVGGRGLDKTIVSSSIELATGGLLPNVTFLFDVDSKIGLKRAQKVGKADRMEQESLDFHNRVRSVYLDLAADNNRFVIINTNNKSIEDVHKEVLEHILKIFD